MIGFNIYTTCLGIHFRRARQFFVGLALLTVLTLSPAVVFGDNAEAGDSAAVTETTALPESDSEARMKELRVEYMQNKRDLHQFETQAEQTGPAKERALEIKQLRRQIGNRMAQLEPVPDQQAALAPEKVAELESQIQELRLQRKEKEAERLALLNQSEEYQALCARRSELMENFRSQLSVRPPTTSQRDGAETNQ